MMPPLQSPGPENKGQPLASPPPTHTNQKGIAQVTAPQPFECPFKYSPPYPQNWYISHNAHIPSHLTLVESAILCPLQKKGGRDVKNHVKSACQQQQQQQQEEEEEEGRGCTPNAIFKRGDDPKQ